MTEIATNVTCDHRMHLLAVIIGCIYLDTYRRADPRKLEVVFGMEVSACAMF